MNLPVFLNFALMNCFTLRSGVDTTLYISNIRIIQLKPPRHRAGAPG
jgi:hypothetical protein